MAQNQPRVSVIDPINPAFKEVKQILFSPFDLGRWLVIGLCAFLADLSGGGFHFHGRFPHGQQGSAPAVPGHLLELIREHIALVVFVGATVFVISAAVAVLLLWLSSRGRFMFLSCVAQNKAEVKAPWRTLREQGNSLFLFRLVAGIIFFLLLGMLGGIVVLCVALLGRVGGHAGVPLVAALALLGLVGLAATLVGAAVMKLTRDFVVPIMYLRKCSCLAGWGEFLSLLSGNIGRFALYLLFQILMALIIGGLVATVMLLTICCCCCAGILLAIPYVGTVLMLPIPVFVRAYSLCYLRQYGPAFDVFGGHSTTQQLIADAP
jgi:hypothetical protein